MHDTLGSSNGKKVAQEYRELMGRKGLGTLCVPSCNYITTCPWETDTTTPLAWAVMCIYSFIAA